MAWSVLLLVVLDLAGLHFVSASLVPRAFGGAGVFFTSLNMKFSQLSLVSFSFFFSL